MGMLAHVGFKWWVVAAVHLQVDIAKIVASNLGCDLDCTGCAQMRYALLGAYHRKVHGIRLPTGASLTTSERSERWKCLCLGFTLYWVQSWGGALGGTVGFIDSGAVYVLNSSRDECQKAFRLEMPLSSMGCKGSIQWWRCVLVTSVLVWALPLQAWTSEWCVAFCGPTDLYFSCVILLLFK